MKNRRKPLANLRRPASRRLKTQNLLEVKIRSELANQQRNRWLMVWTCKLLLASALISGSFYGVREGLRRCFWRNPEYSLATVEITNDGSAISRDVVLNTAGLKMGTNIFNISLAKARESLAGLPQVKHVELQRVLPNKIVIEINERRPVAWLASTQTDDPSASEKSSLIDSAGVVFKPKRQMAEYLRLPSIYGVDAENFPPGEVVDNPEVLSALELIRQNGDANRFQLQSIDLSKGYCMIATDAKRAKITFGLDNVDRQLERLGAVLDYTYNTHRDLQTVNLMVERNIPVTFAVPGAQEPVAEESVKTDKPANPVAKPGGSDKIEKSSPSSGSRTASVKSSEAKKRAALSKKKVEPEIRRAEPVIRRALPVNPMRTMQPVAALIPNH